MVNESAIKEAVLRELRTANNTSQTDFSTDEMNAIAKAILAALQSYDRLTQD